MPLRRFLGGGRRQGATAVPAEGTDRPAGHASRPQYHVPRAIRLASGQGQVDPETYPVHRVGPHETLRSIARDRLGDSRREVEILS